VTIFQALGCCPISPSLKIDIDHVTILIHCSPQVMLLTIDLDKDFIDVESIAVASVLSLQSACV
jgi:hypothetical protein